MAKKSKNATDRIHDRFYLWFARKHPTHQQLIEDGFTRRDLRDAYEAGVRAQCRAVTRGDRSSSGPSKP